MTNTFLILIVAFVALVFSVFYNFGFRKKKERSWGECKMPLARKTKKIFPFAIALCIVMLVVLYFRSVDLWITVVIASTAVLGTHISIQDYIMQSKSGIYENVIITRGKLLKKEEVVAFPTLEYENDSEDASSVPPEMLKTVTNSFGIVFLEFASPEERNKAVELLKDWKN